MGYSRFDLATQRRPAWNAGKNVGMKRPLTQKQIWAIRFHLDREGRLGDKAVFDLAIDNKLRGCDLVKIRMGMSLRMWTSAIEQPSSTRKPTSRCSSKSPLTCEPHC